MYNQNELQKRNRICIVSPDILGPVRNGGIGTSSTFLSYTLADAGYDVSLLFTQCNTTSTKNDAWVESYSRKNISITIAEEWVKNKSIIPSFPNHAPLIMAHTAYKWLVEESTIFPFVAIIFMEWQGSGFYALHSKRCGLHFKNTAMITHMHSPSLWHSINNGDLSGSSFQALTWFMERQSLALADAVVSPSAYMVRWAHESGFSLPAKTYVQPNLFRTDVQSYKRQNSLPSQEIVFFGRLEYRKGIVQFCDAIDLLVKRNILPEQIAFLGKFSWVGSEHAGQYIARRAQKWPVAVKILSNHDQAEALQYLSQEGRLAVMPSVADNSPYTVYECLAAKIPFIARDVGGIAELISPEYHSSCLCDDTPADLADLLCHAIIHGPRIALLAFDLEENQRSWLATLDTIIKSTHEKVLPQHTLPFVSVCVTHFNRPKLLRQAIDSLVAQDYPYFEVILADDGSTDPDALLFLESLELTFRIRGWRILRLRNGYPGRARNAAARIAQGEWLIFLDDDNYARPNMIRCFAESILHANSDIATTSFDIFQGDEQPDNNTVSKERFLPLGGIISFSALTNVIGDTTSIISKKFFERLGGFSEDYGLGHEDFELLLRAALLGASISVIPDSLFWYRKDIASIQHTTNTSANRMRSLRPFLQCNLPYLTELAPLTYLLGLQDTIKEERLAGAPRYYSEQDKHTFTLQDPTAPETLMAVAETLTLSGNVTLALQVLDNISNSKKDFGETLIISKLKILAHEAALQGNLDIFLEYVDYIERKTIEHQQLSVFYTSLIYTLSSNNVCRKEYHKFFDLCFSKIQSYNDITLDACLTTTEILFDDPEREEEALAMFAKTIKISEKQYLEIRPDVLEAIQNNLFNNGLHHYSIYGKDEDITWPEKERIYKIISAKRDIILHSNLPKNILDYI